MFINIISGCLCLIVYKYMFNHYVMEKLEIWINKEYLDNLSLKKEFIELILKLSTMFYP